LQASQHFVPVLRELDRIAEALQRHFQVSAYFQFVFANENGSAIL
jgi:hypothetical protein